MELNFPTILIILVGIYAAYMGYTDYKQGKFGADSQYIPQGYIKYRDRHNQMWNPAFPCYNTEHPSVKHMNLNNAWLLSTGSGSNFDTYTNAFVCPTTP